MLASVKLQKQSDRAPGYFVLTINQILEMVSRTPSYLEHSKVTPIQRCPGTSG